LPESDKTTRRDLLTGAIAAATAATALDAEAVPTQPADNPLFQPESYWSERMKAPDDGKKLGWFVDTRRCFGCHACEVSCKAENDVPLGHFIRQTFTKDVGEYPKVARVFMPMACQHCEDAPCLKACPCGALHKGIGGSVLVDYETCCGHGSCVDVCPYGAIYMDPVAKQAVKCHNCYHRLEHDMEPACVPTCPSEALYFGDLNDDESPISMALANAKKEFGEPSQLRPEKGTKTRMWFAGDGAVELEDRVPREGESYSPAAYNIHQWKEAADAKPKDKP
jgi:tetrathionate reductase subunit B